MLGPEPDQLATKADIGELTTRVHRLEERMDRLEQLMEKFDQRLWEFHEALRAQTRVFATITVSSMLGVASIAFAAATFV